MCNVRLKRFRVSIVAVEKQQFLGTECVFVVLVFQHAKRVPRIIMPSVTPPAVPHFSTFSHKRHD